MSGKLKNFIGKFLKKTKLAALGMQKIEPRVVEPEKPVSFSELLDDCIKLLETPGKVKACYYELDKLMIEVYPMDGDRNIFWIHKHAPNKYGIVFLGGNESFSSEDFGEIEKLEKLFNLCDKKVKETALLVEQQKLAAKQKDLTFASRRIKQYM